MYSQSVARGALLVMHLIFPIWTPVLYAPLIALVFQICHFYKLCRRLEADDLRHCVAIEGQVETRTDTDLKNSTCRIRYNADRDTARACVAAWINV